MRTEKEIGLIIRELRGDLSLRDFAKKCEISHTSIDNLEKGIDHRTGKPTQVKVATLQKIADACLVPLSYITDEEKPAEDDGLSPNRRKLIDFVQSVPEEKVDQIYSVIQSILEALK
jgi:transcriptional regulator with XRE-family HTH domain